MTRTVRMGRFPPPGGRRSPIVAASQNPARHVPMGRPRPLRAPLPPGQQGAQRVSEGIPEVDPRRLSATYPVVPRCVTCPSDARRVRPRALRALPARVPNGSCRRCAEPPIVGPSRVTPVRVVDAMDDGNVESVVGADPIRQDPTDESSVWLDLSGCGESPTRLIARSGRSRSWSWPSSLTPWRSASQTSRRFESRTRLPTTASPPIRSRPRCTRPAWHGLGRTGGSCRPRSSQGRARAGSAPHPVAGRWPLPWGSGEPPATLISNVPGHIAARRDGAVPGGSGDAQRPWLRTIGAIVGCRRSDGRARRLTPRRCHGPVRDPVPGRREPGSCILVIGVAIALIALAASPSGGSLTVTYAMRHQVGGSAPAAPSPRRLPPRSIGAADPSANA